MGLFRARGVILSVLVKLCRGTLARSQRYSQVRGIHEDTGRCSTNHGPSRSYVADLGQPISGLFRFALR